MSKIFWLVLLFPSQSVFAFPEMVRAGYQNCTACHLSPSGGGALTEYGRAISAELLSTWSYKGEEQFGHGLIGEPPKWLQMGGDVRWIKTYTHGVDGTENQKFVMETDIEPALKLGNLTVVGAVGVAGGPNDDPDHGKFISREHYAMYQMTDEAYVRAGKYEIPFGIKQPNHEVVTRMGLGFDEGSETYNVETGYIGEKINLTATLDLGRFDDHDQYAQTGNGASVNFAYNLFNSFKLGYSAFHGSMNGTQKTITGPYALLGFTKHLVLLSEFYYQWQRPVDSLEQKGPVIYNRLQYEFIQGVHGYVEGQFAKQDMTTDLSEVDAYAVGFNFYPRPHFEILGNWGKSRAASDNTKYSDVGWVQAHYYF